MENEVPIEQLVAEKREIRGLYLTSLGTGPTASVIVIFIQLIIIKQTKYLAAENSYGENWIEWRESYLDGKLCNGTGKPYPKDSMTPYSRPEGYPSKCVWFPSKKTVPGTNIQYTNTIIYGTAAILFVTGALLLVIGPFSDYGSYRKQILIGCVVVWIPTFSIIAFIGNPNLYFISLICTVIGSIAFFFGLKSPLAAYLPLLIHANHELAEMRQRRNVRSVALPDAIPNPEFEASSFDPRFTEPTRTAQNEESNNSFSEDYRRLYETVASRTAITETAFFIGGIKQSLFHYNIKVFSSGQLICLLPQFALIVILTEEDDPRNTKGEQGAILIATLWAAIITSIGISWLKNRPGGAFPPGNRFLTGIKRSFKTLKLLHGHLSMLLSLMISRMLFWLVIQTILSMSVLFFEREFSIGTADLAPIILLYLAVGVPSALMTSLLIQKCTGNILKIFKVYCFLVMCLPLYMWIGVRHKYEIYVLMCVSSILLAPFPSMVKAMMADMIPQGYTSTIMSLEGLLENCSTWIGPLIVGGILDLTNSLRFGLFCLEVFMILGLPFILCTDLQKGHEQRLRVEALFHSYPDGHIEGCTLRN